MKKERSSYGKKKLSKKQILLIVILALLFIFIAIGLITAGHYMGLINHVGEVDAIEESFDGDPNALDTIDPNDIKWDLSGPLGDEHLLNIMLIGQDKREGQGRQRSDVMMLASVNLETKQVSLISFMRDLYVQIPDHSDNKLNAAYVFGGFPLLKETFYQNFGITIDGCFEVDFAGFIKSIDIIGGVDVGLTKAEAEALGIKYSDAPVHMDGKTALEYARLRRIDSDFGRTDRQKRIMLSAAQKLRTSGVKELLDLVNAVLPSITTDMSTTQIYSLAAKAAPLVATAEIKTFTVPGGDTYKNEVIRGMQVLLPDLKGIKKDLKESFMPF